MKGVDHHETPLFTQRTVPPPRTLVPRILAALAAGAFTLGAQPYVIAAPDQMTSVTEDVVTSEGVAGSIDGTAATITVGTKGGGGTPQIGTSLGHKRDIYGSYYTSSEADKDITLTGGRAVVRSGSMGGAHGAYALLEVGGSARILTPSAEITDGRMGGGVQAGSAEVRATGSGNAAAEVTQAVLKITDGRFSYGSVDGGTSRALTEAGTARATVSGCRVEVDGGYYWMGGSGGVASVDTKTGTAQAKASENKIYLRGGEWRGSIYGGVATRGMGYTRLEGVSEGNEVHISGGSYSGGIYGGGCICGGRRRLCGDRPQQYDRDHGRARSLQGRTRGRLCCR